MLNQDHCLPGKQIVCVLERGQSKAILEQLHALNLVAAGEFLAVRNQHAMMSESDWVEMDVLKVLVYPQYADQAFELIYEMAQVESREGVYLFQHHVPWMTHFELPQLPADGLNMAELEDAETLPEGLSEQALADLKKLSES